MLTRPDAELARLPIRYDQWARERLQEWRAAMQPRLAAKQVVSKEPRGSWVIYTFAGTVANLLLTHWLRAHETQVLRHDAWRVWCADPPPIRGLAECSRELLARLVQAEWQRYVRNLPLPPMFRHLPESLQREEVLSMLDLETSARLLRGLAESVDNRAGVVRQV